MTLNGDGMTAAEFAAARKAIGWTHDEVAAELGITPAVVRGWAAGTVPVPRRFAKQLAWEAAIAERRAALQASGLPECGWMNTHLEGIPADADGLERHQRATQAHAANCEVCRARERYETEHLGPLPPPPLPAWMYMFRWIDRVPQGARPAVVGAALLAAVVLVRVLLSPPALLAAQGGLVEVVLAIGTAAGAGAAGGLAYSLTRPSLRKLGRVGAYLTGIVCVLAYTGALAIAAPVAFGERIVDGRADLVIFGVVSLVFGLMIGHAWFREPGGI